MCPTSIFHPSQQLEHLPHYKRIPHLKFWPPLQRSQSLNKRKRPSNNIQSPTRQFDPLLWVTRPSINITVTQLNTQSPHTRNSQYSNIFNSIKIKICSNEEQWWNLKRSRRQIWLGCIVSTPKPEINARVSKNPRKISKSSPILFSQ
jgi:hypothetical protein